MIVSIGILAHNESGDIGNLISDLTKQSLLSKRFHSIEIHVVANGCTDNTASVSKEALAAKQFKNGNITTLVHSVPRAGKSNAWNELIHKFASPQTEFIFLLDADIRIPEKQTLQLVLDKLIQEKTACVAVDESVKDLSEEVHKSTIERLILAASGTAYDTRTALAGGFYCARFEVLKDIWMPTGLPGEDGFLRAMILTSNFSEDEDLRRIVFVEDARHIFESERTVRGVYRHNIRLAIGTGVNVLLFIHIRELLKKKVDIANYIKQRNANDQNWVNELVVEEMRRVKYFLLNKEFILKRLKRLASLPISQQLRKWPIFVLGFAFDVALFFTANRLMRKGAGAGYW